MQNLRILPLAIAAGLLLPAVPALAAPTYTSEGSVTYFGSGIGSPLLILPLTTVPAQTTPPSPTLPAATAPATAVGAFSSGSTTYFVPGLGQWVAQAAASTGSVRGASSGSGSGASGTNAGTSASGTGTSPGDVGNNASLSSQFLSLVNQARQQAGLGTLADSPILDQLALAKAQDMVDYGYVDHYSPRLGWPINQEQAAGFVAQSMGAENIAEAGSIQRAMIDLMSDAGHKANLLDPAFTQTGIAVLPVTGGVLVEELFAGPSF